MYYMLHTLLPYSDSREDMLLWTSGIQREISDLRTPPTLPVRLVSVDMYICILVLLLLYYFYLLHFVYTYTYTYTFCVFICIQPMSIPVVISEFTSPVPDVKPPEEIILHKPLYTEEVRISVYPFVYSSLNGCDMVMID